MTVGGMPIVWVAVGGLLHAGLLGLLILRRHLKKKLAAMPERQQLDRIKALAGCETDGELYDDALNFYTHAQELIADGWLVGAQDPDGQFMQILTPGLRWTKQTARLTGQEGGGE